MTAAGLSVDWIDGKRKPTGKADPRYPNGIELDFTAGAKRACLAVFPQHPAPRCGFWLVKCEDCGVSVVVTTAGRADDPRSVTVACKPLPGLGGKA